MNHFDNIDCMIGMKEYSDKHFDLAIVDPPYGKRPTRGINGFGVADTIRFQPNDDKWDIKPAKAYWNELFRISKNQVVWGGNCFIDVLSPTNCFLIWDKKNGENPYADAELAWTSFTSVSKIYRQFWLGSHIHRVEDIIHPTQKPVALYKWLLTKYAKQGDLILDTHVGSASSLIACEDMGFEYVGFEIDKDYFDAANKRLEQFRSQFKLELQ